MNTSVATISSPYPTIAHAAHAGATDAGQHASATSGPSLLAIAPDACIHARPSGEASRYER